jgi:archaeal type IV pilus assembly protein PilA
MDGMKSNRKFKQEDEAVSAVIGVILMVAITVAIAATVYVYVSGMIGTDDASTENAVATATSGGSGEIRIMLTKGGQNYNTGYTDFNITLSNSSGPVYGTDSDGTWTVGESIYVTGLDPGEKYAVTITILDTVIYDNDNIRAGS